MRFMRNWSQVRSAINPRYTDRRESFRPGYAIRIDRNLDFLFFLGFFPSTTLTSRMHQRHRGNIFLLIRASLNEETSRRSLFTYGYCARGRHIPVIKISINPLPPLPPRPFACRHFHARHADVPRFSFRAIGRAEHGNAFPRNSRGSIPPSRISSRAIVRRVLQRESFPPSRNLLSRRRRRILPRFSSLEGQKRS